MTFEVAWNLAKFSPAYGVDDKTVEVHVLMNVHDNQGSTMHLEEIISGVPVWFLSETKEKLQSMIGHLKQEIAGLNE
jgi:hypothetical protein